MTRKHSPSACLRRRQCRCFPRLFENQHLYDSLVDAFSMRSFVASAGASGHDHFFRRVRKNSQIVDPPPHRRMARRSFLSRGAAQNEQYLELMDTPPFLHTIQVANDLGWQDDLAKFRQALLDHGLRDDVAVARGPLGFAPEKLRDERQHCGQPDAFSRLQRRNPLPLPGASRVFRNQQVFAQALPRVRSGVGLIRAPPGINFVMPEDGYISMTDFALHMRMVDFLSRALSQSSHHASMQEKLHRVSLLMKGLCCHGPPRSQRRTRRAHRPTA